MDYDKPMHIGLSNLRKFAKWSKTSSSSNLTREAILRGDVSVNGVSVFVIIPGDLPKLTWIN